MNRGKILKWCCLGLVFLFLFSQTVQVQWLLRQFLGERVQREKADISPTLATACRPSDSDIEAADKTRNAWIDADRVAQRKEAEKAAIFSPDYEMLEQLDLTAHQNSPGQGFMPPPDFDLSTPQVVVETRLLWCQPGIIAPEGFTAEQGWRFFPSAEDQKAPVRQRLADLSQEDSPPLAAGVFQCDEYHMPALFRFMDDSQADLIVAECQFSPARNHVLMAPKVTLLSGFPGKVDDMTEISAGGRNSRVNSEESSYQERIMVGTFLDLLPEVLDDDSVQMKRFLLQFRNIVEEPDFAVTHDEEGPMVFPKKVGNRIFHCPVTIPKGKTLCVVIPVEIRSEGDHSGDYFGMPPLRSFVRQPTVLCLAVSSKVIRDKPAEQPADQLAEQPAE